MSQIPLWFDTYQDAIRATVMALGGYKQVGSMLKPSMPPDAAGRWLNDTLNPEKREKLDISELAFIRKEARRRGIDTLAAYEMREAGYADPQPLVFEDEEARLKREFIEAVKGLKSIEGRMERLSALRSVA
jgi:hypothetical protein